TSALQDVLLAIEQLYHRRANGAEAGKTQFQRRDHGPSESATRPIQRRLARGTTLCNFSGPVSRKRRKLRAAWRIRCSFSTSAIRTEPSPCSPKPMPGETATSAFSINRVENSMV